MPDYRPRGERPGYYPRDWNYTGFVRCEGGLPGKKPKTTTLGREYVDGKFIPKTVLQCRICKRLFGSFDYFDRHGDFHGKAPAQASEASATEEAKVEVQGESA